ncbi:Aspartyl protease family protein [Thalictrum thalictroides]|uniref:Aspartyl protease family protein n=1 Tax=Thalictrum thalictroides TaxID=46969 RepID=A0A7J6XAK0_THATH|nr:Aspartyl protease family protein [Thalictrum thalictroides]
MAATELGFLFIFLFISSVFSRTLLETPTTTVLDVSSSIQQTHDLLSFNPDSLQKQSTSEEEQLSSSSSADLSSFTLQLHSRDTLHKSSHKDYKSLTLARLERDSARVKSLNLKLDLAINGIKKSDLKPSQEQEVELKEGGDLQGPIVSGTSQGSGEYFSRVGIGSPPKQQYLVLDTGSDVTWVQCAPCTDCYQQTDPIFEPSSSSSYVSLSCGTEQCRGLDVSACRNGSCLYQVSYGDGSYTVGDFVTETLSFGDTSVEKVAIGCGHDNEGLFVGSAGLLGLGGGSLSFPSQVKSSAFSYCLVDRDSTSGSTLQFGSNAQPNNAVTAPLAKNRQLDTFYYVGISGMSVGGAMLSIPPSLFEMDESGNGGIIVDSGTAITRLRTDAYNSLRDAFVKGTQNLQSTSGVALFDTCYDLSSKTSVEVPTVSFHFPGGKSLPLPAKNYLIPVDSSGTFCFAFAPTSNSLSIIGNVQQQGTRVSVDLANSLVGFSPNQC